MSHPDSRAEQILEMATRIRLVVLRTHSLLTFPHPGSERSTPDVTGITDAVGGQAVSFRGLLRNNRQYIAH